MHVKIDSEPCIQDIIAIFDRVFSTRENTRLIKGNDEPWYIPANKDCNYHQVVFAHGFFSSALHELAHWCIAGKERRLKVDYGYWYEEDGRSLDQQFEFAKVEAKPQALEWILSHACNYRFYISLDNLNASPGDMAPFKEAVYEQVEQFKTAGLPSRALLLQQALADFYGQPNDWLEYVFSLSDL